MKGVLNKLYHFPIKGLSAQPLAEVAMRAGEGFPYDRVFGFARHDSGFDPRDPHPLPKDRFLVLLKEERLAGLQTAFDPDRRHLLIQIQGRPVLEADLARPEGIAAAASFIATMFDLPPDRRPVLAHAAPHRFTDVSVVSSELMNAVSLINLSSVQDLERRIGAPVNPLRFRANIYFAGWPPFAELALLDEEIAIGGVRLKVTRRTRRCAATEVNPITARRDLPIPRLIMQTYGHTDMGVYAEVLNAGIIRPGDAIIA